jgi:hypothetical protein
MWANSVWGLCGLAVTLGLAMIALPPDYIWLQPYFAVGAIFSSLGSVGVLCWPLRNPQRRAIVLVKIQHPAKWIAELIEPSHVIIIGLLIALAGTIWSYRRQPLVTVLHDPPSAEDIAKAAAPIQQKLNIAAKQRDDALAEVAALKRQIENPPNARSQLAPPNPVEYRRLSRDQMGVLVQEFSEATDVVPKIFLSSSTDVRGEANQYMRDFMETLVRAGTKFETLNQTPKGPQQTGVMISVRDPENPPPSAQKTQSILRDAGITAPIVSLPTELNNLSTGFTLFVGPNPL